MLYNEFLAHECAFFTDWGFKFTYGLTKEEALNGDYTPSLDAAFWAWSV